MTYARLTLGSLLLAASIPALAAATRGFWPGALLCALAGGVWLGARRWRTAPPWLGDVCWAALLLGGALTLMDGGSAPALLLGGACGVAAWDLDRFAGAMAGAALVADADLLWRDHLRRLGLALLIGLVAGGVAIGVSIDLGFGWDFAIAAATLYLLTLLIRAVRRP